MTMQMQAIIQNFHNVFLRVPGSINMKMKYGAAEIVRLNMNANMKIVCSQVLEISIMSFRFDSMIL